MHQKSSPSKKTRRSRYAATHGKKESMPHIALRRSLLKKVAEERTIPEQGLQWIGGVLYRSMGGDWIEVSGVQRVPKPGRPAIGIAAGAQTQISRRGAEDPPKPTRLSLTAWVL
ncbi:hypothetical protein K2X96_01765 [Patescibacteria group bacterium]|nr:hypothetical protein [Patescibacteria group bacterium]